MHSCVKTRNLLNQRSSELNVSNEASSSRCCFFLFRRGEDRHGRAWNVVDDYLGKPCQMGCSI